MSPGIHKIANGILLIDRSHCLRGGTGCYCSAVRRVLRQVVNTDIPFSMAHGHYCLVSDFPPHFDSLL